MCRFAFSTNGKQVNDRSVSEIRITAFVEKGDKRMCGEEGRSDIAVMSELPGESREMARRVITVLIPLCIIEGLVIPEQTKGQCY